MPVFPSAVHPHEFQFKEEVSRGSIHATARELQHEHSSSRCDVQRYQVQRKEILHGRLLTRSDEGVFPSGIELNISKRGESARETSDKKDIGEVTEDVFNLHILTTPASSSQDRRHRQKRFNEAFADTTENTARSRGQDDGRDEERSSPSSPIRSQHDAVNTRGDQGGDRGVHQGGRRPPDGEEAPPCRDGRDHAQGEGQDFYVQADRRCVRVRRRLI